MLQQFVFAECYILHNFHLKGNKLFKVLRSLCGNLGGESTNSTSIEMTTLVDSKELAIPSGMIITRYSVKHIRKLSRYVKYVFIYLQHANI